MRSALARFFAQAAASLSVWLAAGALAGCLAPQEVGVKPVSAEQSRAELDACALTSNQLSSGTREVLQLFDLATRFGTEPEETIRALHAIACKEPIRALRFALAEMCYQTAKQKSDRRWYLGSAVYAYLYLLEEGGDEPANPFDRRFRWACELYNQGLLRACTRPNEQDFELADGSRPLPVGSLAVRVDRSALSWSSEAFPKYLAADLFRIDGLTLRLRDSGLGVPLIGVGSVKVDQQDTASRLRRGTNAAPATVFLRVEGGLAALEHGAQAVFELHSAFELPTTTVAGKPVPLETDLSAALAYALDEPSIWRFSLSGLFAGENAPHSNRLILGGPYERGRIPVVLIHGTASSPAYWADLFNSLMRDPELRRRLQFWFFQYASGNPIIYTAADLRDALEEAVKTLDPEGKDPGLRQMVLVGHSQGGLLVRLMTMHGSVAWLEEISGRTLEDFHFSESERALVERTLDFQPVPYVKQAVFMSTPHRGSFLSERWFSRVIDSFIGVPREISAVGRRIFADEARLPKELRGRSMTSLDNMDPDSPLLRRLAEEPLNPDVVFHSIISIGDADPNDPEELAKADDGVVEYKSAHIEGVASEALVRSGHSCQSAPATIQELRRILLEHVRGQP